LLPVLQGYIKELTGGKLKSENYNNPPAWLVDLEKEFGIKSHRGKWS
jgi:hypothetical protein